jgi:hypothetical protein
MRNIEQVVAGVVVGLAIAALSVFIGSVLAFWLVIAPSSRVERKRPTWPLYGDRALRIVTSPHIEQATFVQVQGAYNE